MASHCPLCSLGRQPTALSDPEDLTQGVCLLEAPAACQIFCATYGPSQRSFTSDSMVGWLGKTPQSPGKLMVGVGESRTGF